MERRLVVLRFARLRLAGAAALAAITGCQHPPASPTHLANASSSAAVADDLVVRVRCTRVRKTGKRHQSYIFHFDVVQVIQGDLAADTIELAELFADLGGSRLAQALHVRGPDRGEATCRGVVTLRLHETSAGLEFQDIVSRAQKPASPRP